MNKLVNWFIVNICVLKYSPASVVCICVIVTVSTVSQTIDRLAVFHCL